MSYYAGGKRQEEGMYDRGQRTGTWTVHYETGGKKEERQFRADQLEGAYIAWYENGTKSLDGQYVKGKKQGTWTQYEAEAGEATRIEKYNKGRRIAAKAVKPKKVAARKQ
ncbi:toxin-antitoxin system YwqK family antitoxin [Myxococcota bacterium]